MKSTISKTWIVVAVLFVFFIVLHTNISSPKKISVEAVNGEIDLRNWDFDRDGIVHLDGQWEVYFNELFEPGDLTNRKAVEYFHIPGKLETQLDQKTTGYMTMHLKVLVPDSVFYGIRIRSMLAASKLWVNDIFHDSHGKVGKSAEEEQAIYLPIYAYFTSENGVVDIVIQTSNYRDIHPIIRSMDFGLKKQIKNVYSKSISMDMLIVGSLFIIELLNLAMYLLRKREKSFLYFSIMCFLIQLRCLILNERILVQLHPDMPYELLSKTAAITYYLWIMIYVLFLKEQFKGLSNKIMFFTISFSTIFTGICLATGNRIYDKLAIPGQTILCIIIIYLLIFLIKKSIERHSKAKISLLAFLVLIVTAFNDILINNGIISNMYVFQIGMFIFAFLESYMLAVKYTNGFNRLEELSIENQKIYEMAIKDGLTELYNRKYIEQILISKIERYKEIEEIFSVFMIDIDYFKDINDRYGHPFGDEVIVTISSILKKNLRATDYVGRYGGEEFLVILPNTNREEARNIAERVRQSIENFSWPKENLKITVSIGLYENNIYTKEECVEQVDKLLYMAKKMGRNRVEEVC